MILVDSPRGQHRGTSGWLVRCNEPPNGHVFRTEEKRRRLFNLSEDLEKVENNWS